MGFEHGMPLPSQPRHGAQVVSTRLDDGGVLVHLGTNRIFELNATGFRIWELIGEGRDLTAIEQTLQEEFTVPAEQVRQELHDLIGALLTEGLLDAGRQD